jgi:predicted DsbA family dithiol-disulfide isomerase
MPILNRAVKYPLLFQRERFDSGMVAGSQTSKHTIDIISDTICPWCYIGKRRLERALELLGKSPVSIYWRPFELNATMPPGGFERREYRTRKFGSWERSLQLDAQVRAAGEEVGLEFQHDKITRTPNTFLSHKLIRFAGTHGVQDEVVEAVFRAYFMEGQDIGDAEVLAALGNWAGLDFAHARAALDDATISAAVREEEQRALAFSITGVPTFVVDGEPIGSGAQHESVLAEILANRV